MRATRYLTGRHVSAALAAVAALALVTGAIYGLKSTVPPLGLGVLYMFAVLPVAVFWGLAYAVPTAIASMLLYNWFFLPPRHSLHLNEAEHWIVLGVYLVTAVVVSELAARSRRQTREAEQRAREASLLAEVAGSLLESGSVDHELPGIAARVASVMGSKRGSIELGSVRRPSSGEVAHDLAAGDRHVGRLFVDTEARPDPAAAGRLLSALGSLLAVAAERERLARRALEAETLRRSDAVKTAILRSVSHDLRSPLTAVRAATEGLQSAFLDLSAADRATLLATIDTETKRLDRLFGNLLDLSRLEVGAATARPELWTVDGVIARALQELGDQAERVSVSLADDLPPIQVDGSQIERVLVNVLENALKFSSSATPVQLHGERRGGAVFIRVADSGPGVRTEDLERIFDPFERGTASGRGSGLGLAIARGFAEANGGRLSAESTPAGAAFVLELPAAPAPVTA